MKLVIGNKNYSSWSLRPWILLKHAQVEFEEVRIPLFTDKGKEMIDELCPAKQVPVLYDAQLVLWDSLAICEYVADKYSDKKLWPEDNADRARARAMSAEMHSGFASLRQSMPMNCRRVVADFKPDLKTEMDIDRVVQLFEQSLTDSKGPWLFGEYSVADAMYAPIVSRFKTYGVSGPAKTQAYCQHVLSDELIKPWFLDALNEKEVIEASEIS